MRDFDSRSDFPCLISNEVVGFDIFGFAIFKPDLYVDSERHHVYKKRVFPKDEIAAWEKLFEDWESTKTTLTAKVHAFLRRGVPLHLRPRLWKKQLDVQAWQSSVKFNYQSELSKVRAQLVDLGISEYGGQAACAYLSELELDSYRVKFGDVSMDALRHIFLDLERSYPTHRMFMGDTPEAKEGRASMFRLLATYARYNTKVEYCQGMASIAGMFLMQMGDEEDAFWCMLSLLERQKYLLGYFDNSMERLKKHAAVYDRLLSQRFPKLQRHLDQLDINPLMYITPWFMVLFTSLPCWDTVLAIWDLLLMEGNKTIFQVALSILETQEEEIMGEKDLCHVLPNLLHPPVNVVEYDSLMPLVWTTHIEDWEISSLLAVIAEENVISEEKVLPVLPSSGQKRKHSDQEDDKVVRFTGVPEQRKRQRVLTETETAHPDERPVKTAAQEVSVFKRFVNMFTPKPDPRDPASPRPRHTKSRAARRGRQSTGADKPKTLRPSRHSREQLHIPSSKAHTKTLNIDKGYSLRISPTTTATATTDLDRAVLKPAEDKQNTNTSEKISKVQNQEVCDSFTPDLLKNVKSGVKVSPCLEANENSFIECDRLSELKICTPVRRSPRLLQKRALKDVNSPLVLSNRSPLKGLRHNLQTPKGLRMRTPRLKSSPKTPNSKTLPLIHHLKTELSGLRTPPKSARILWLPQSPMGSVMYI